MENGIRKDFSAIALKWNMLAQQCKGKLQWTEWVIKLMSEHKQNSNAKSIFINKM